MESRIYPSTAPVVILHIKTDSKHINFIPLIVISLSTEEFFYTIIIMSLSTDETWTLDLQMETLLYLCILEFGKKCVILHFKNV